MLIFKPILDKALVKTLFQENGFCSSARSMAFSAQENDSASGLCLYEVDGMKAVVYRVICPPKRPDLAEGLLRSALNCAGGKGAYFVRLQDTNYPDVAHAMGFQQTEQGMAGEIPEILMGSCQNFGKI